MRDSDRGHRMAVRANGSPAGSEAVAAARGPPLRPRWGNGSRIGTGSSSSSTGESWAGDPEARRRRRVTAYKAYAAESKVRASLRNGLRWFKARCSALPCDGDRTEEQAGGPTPGTGHVTSRRVARAGAGFKRLRSWLFPQGRGPASAVGLRFGELITAAGGVGAGRLLADGTPPRSIVWSSFADRPDACPRLAANSPNSASRTS
ncbi:hypothetical protein GW17_00018423 [Ensete ventricosum]|nr:hypothetical protein GW17_00018423 [Ensete ventricosum]